MTIQKLQTVTVIASAAISRNRFVGWTGAHSTSVDDVLGLSEAPAAIGGAVSVVTEFSAPVEAAGAINVGDYVAPANDGTGRAVVGSVANNCGRALVGAAGAGSIAVVAVFGSERGGSVSGAWNRPASTSIVLDGDYQHDPLVVSGATTITVTGSTPGGRAAMIVLPNGTNVPTISGADEWATSFGYLNTANVPNLLTAWYDGIARRYAWGRQLSPAAVDYAAPTIQSATVDASTLTIVWSENLANSPSASAFTVTGAGGVTQTPASASHTNATTTLTLTTPAVGSNTVTLAAAAGAASDAAGNNSAAVSGVSVTVAGETALALTTLVSLTASGANYVGSTGVTSPNCYGRPAGVIAGDGWVSVGLASAVNGAAIVGLSSTASPTAGTTMLGQMAISTFAGVVRYGSGNTPGASNTDLAALEAAGPSVRYRIGRAGSAWTIAKSTNNGDTWTTIFTFPGVFYTGTLYPVIYTAGDNTVYSPKARGVA